MRSTKLQRSHFGEFKIQTSRKPLMHISQEKESSKGFCHHITGLMLRAFCITLLGADTYAQSIHAAHQQVAQFVDQGAANWKKVSKDIWDYAELGYHENKSSNLLQTQLKSAGFTIQSG